MILITGYNGFIGRVLIQSLVKLGQPVVCAGRSPLSEILAKTSGLTWARVDLASGEGLDSIPWAQVTKVIHLAAAGVKASQRAWHDALATNVIGTYKLIDCLQRLKAPPQVFAARTFYEQLIDSAPQLWDNPYIASKVTANRLIIEWAKNYPGEVIMGTFFQVYGPGDSGGNVLSYAANRLANGQIAEFGSGKGLRDWVFVDDAAAAVVAAITTPQIGLRSIDIGSGKLVSIREAVERLALIAGLEPEQSLRFDPTRDRPDVDLVAYAQNFAPGWKPATGLDDGLRNMLGTAVINRTLQ